MKKSIELPVIPNVLIPSDFKMKMTKKILLIIISISFLVGCDLSTKQIAQKELKGQTGKSYLGGTVQLVYAENSGGMLSFGDELPDAIRFVIFQLFVAVMLVLFLFYTFVKRDLNKLQIFAFVLFLSGGFGNLIDRITNEGNVIDFIILEIFSFRTGIFNVADFYVTIGISVLLISSVVKLNYSSKLAV